MYTSPYSWEVVCCIKEPIPESSTSRPLALYWHQWLIGFVTDRNFPVQQFTLKVQFTSVPYWLSYNSPRDTLFTYTSYPRVGLLRALAALFRQEFSLTARDPGAEAHRRSACKRYPAVYSAELQIVANRNLAVQTASSVKCNKHPSVVRGKVFHLKPPLLPNVWSSFLSEFPTTEVLVHIQLPSSKENASNHRFLLKLIRSCAMRETASSIKR